MAMCPRCAGKDLVQFDLSPGGRHMRFSTCRQCEHRWWMDAQVAGVIDLDTVLSAVAAA